MNMPRRLRIRSLRGRLLAVILIVMTGFWLVWSCLIVMYLTREQSGWLDHSLREIAHQVMTSLPQDITRLPSGSEPLSLAGDAAIVSRRDEQMSFQIWALPGTLLLRSAESPHTPLQPQFRDGYRVEEIDGRQWRVYAVTDAGGRIQVQTGKPLDLLKNKLWHATKAALVMALLIFGILGTILAKVIRWSLRPVTQLQRNIAERKEYDLAPLPAVDCLPEEIRPLIESFNRLLMRIDRAINNERQFIADAAHELRTPMAAVRTHAEVALHATDPDEIRTALHRLIAAVERGTRMAQQLLDSARLESGRDRRHDVVDLAELVPMVTHEFDAIARQNRQTVVLNTETCPVHGDIDELGILVRNLLDNALRYSGEGSRIEIECRLKPGDGGSTLRVSDNGPGVPDASERARIFDRFFRATGNGQRGSGVGLSLVRRIAESHGAHVAIEDGLAGRGICICVHFPPAA